MKVKLRLINKWCKMILGKSVFHMKQEAGSYYTKNALNGYYSDLRHKVKFNKLLDQNGIPINVTNNGDVVYFAITIFQYGLGLYDLYLESNDETYKTKFFKIINWTVENQNSDGSWDAFGWKNKNARFSSMAQGEGASLLLRSYMIQKNEMHLERAKKAIDFMLTPVEKGGTTRYFDEGITFEESMSRRTVLNGMIFSIWGLYDLVLVTHDSYYGKFLDKAIRYLCLILHRYDCRYWSLYNLDGDLASPFYHDLHIEQLKVMCDLFQNQTFLLYLSKWENYRKSFFKSKKAIIIKGIQKLKQINTNIDLVK